MRYVVKCAHRLRWWRERQRFRKLYKQKSVNHPERFLYARHLEKKNCIKTAMHYVEVSDVLDNKSLNRALKRLKKIERYDNVRDFHMSFRVRKIGKFDYIRSNLFGTSTGLLCEFSLSEGSIREVIVSYTPISDSLLFVTYKFYFRKVLRTHADMVEVVNEWIDRIRLNPSFVTYADKKIIRSEMSNRDLLRLDSEIFFDVFQGLVCTYSYSSIGYRNGLPITLGHFLLRSNRKVLQRIEKLPFRSALHKRDGSSVLSIELLMPRTICEVFSIGRRIEDSPILSYASYYGFEFYLTLFSRYESEEVEVRFAPYYNGSKKRVRRKDLRWLIRRLHDVRNRRNMIAEWEQNQQECPVRQWKDDPRFPVFSFPRYSDKFENIYQENLSYIEAIGGRQNSSIVTTIASLTLVATILGIAATVFCSIMFA